MKPKRPHQHLQEAAVRAKVGTHSEELAGLKSDLVAIGAHVSQLQQDRGEHLALIEKLVESVTRISKETERQAAAIGQLVRDIRGLDSERSGFANQLNATLNEFNARLEEIHGGGDTADWWKSQEGE